jgi:hypothetical protein
MDGNAEGYVLYGFQTMQGVTCEKGGVTFVIDISDFGDADSAYGMFSATHDPGQPMVKVGMAGQIVPRRALFVKGKYYAEIAANPEGDHTETLRQWISTLEKTLDGFRRRWRGSPRRSSRVCGWYRKACWASVF